MSVGLFLLLPMLCMFSTPNITWHQDKRIIPIQVILQLFKATASYELNCLSELPFSSHYHLSFIKSTFSLLYLTDGTMSDLFLLNTQAFQRTGANIHTKPWNGWGGKVPLEII